MRHSFYEIRYIFIILSMKTGFSLYFETESLLYNNYNQYKIITNYTKLTYTIYAKNKNILLKFLKLM